MKLLHTRDSKDYLSLKLKFGVTFIEISPKSSSKSSSTWAKFLLPPGDAKNCEEKEEGMERKQTEVVWLFVGKMRKIWDEEVGSF